MSKSFAPRTRIRVRDWAKQRLIEVNVCDDHTYLFGSYTFRAGYVAALRDLQTFLGKKKRRIIWQSL